MLRTLFTIVHLLLACLCGVMFVWAGLAGSEGSGQGMAASGMIVFAGMAATCWTRSRWVLVPGTILVLASLAATFMFLFAFMWPERAQNTALAISGFAVLFEITAVATTLAGCSNGVGTPGQTRQPGPDSPA